MAAFFTWLLLFFGMSSPPPCGDIELVDTTTCEDVAPSPFFSVANDISNGI